MRQTERRDVDGDSIRSFLERRLPELAIENRTGEIIWFLLLAIRLNVALSASKIDALFGLENAFIALLVTVAKSRNNIVGQVDHAQWSGFLSSEGLHSSMWLYAYESVRQGVNPTGDSAFIEQNPFFAPLLEKKVSFFDPNAGFTSMSSTLRERRGENSRADRLRADFLADFDIDFDEFDDDEDDDIVDIY